MSSNSWKTLGNVSNTNNLNNVGFDSVVSNNIIVKNNASINGKLTVNYLEVFQDTSFNGQVYIGSGTTQIGDVNMNSRLLVAGDVSMGSRLFVLGDVSMGSRLYVVGDASISSRLFVTGDVSMGSRLYVVGDASISSRLFVFQDASIGGTLYVRGNAIFQNPFSSAVVLGDVSIGGTLYVRGSSILVDDASFASRVIVAGDASLGSRLLVAGDVSMGSRLYVRGDVSMGSRLYVVGDASISSRLFVAGDVSIGGTLYVRGSSIHVGDASFASRVIVAGDASFASRVIVAGDASLGSRLLVTGDVSMGSRLYVRGDVSMGSRLYVVGDASISSRLFVAGDVSIGGSLYVAGNTRFPIPLGNVALVDSINGNDSTASVGGRPYLTVAAALAAVTSGQTVWILPGTYTLALGITIPTGVSVRGLSLQTVTVQMLGVTANTTLVTMGENSRIEDITFKLTSSGHYTLTGIAFAGTTSITTKLRTCVLTVDNSTASSGGTSTVTGILCSGTGTLGPGSFSFNSLKGSTVNVYSNGAGNKRGVLVNNSNIITTRDLNIYVAQPTDTASTGSYVGVEVNDPANTGSIQMRSTTVGVVTPTGSQTYTASDILQTTPATITNPSYLASPGIQIGPGTDLVTKTAGSKGFSTYVYPTTIFYGLKGSVGNINSGYLWPGSQEPKNNVFPDITTPAAAFRIQQPSILSGLSVALNTAPTGTSNNRYVTLLVRHTPISTGTIVDTLFTVTIANSDLSGAYYNSSKSLNTGDKLHLYYTCGGSAGNTATDLTVQLDMF